MEILSETRVSTIPIEFALFCFHCLSDKKSSSRATKQAPLGVKGYKEALNLPALVLDHKNRTRDSVVVVCFAVYIAICTCTVQCIVCIKHYHMLISTFDTLSSLYCA